MRRIEIEAWALRVMETVEANRKVEDANVELKSIWIDPVKAARRLAGHANAARGDTILWLIGVDEENGITGAPAQELSNWFSAVQAQFDGVYPDLQDLVVSFKDKTIAALCFATDRAPYVVRNPAFGKMPGESVQLEVPWREGIKTRSATRNDLLLLLSTQVVRPKVELLKCRIDRKKDYLGLYLSAEVYVVPAPNSFCVFPFHKTSASFRLGWETFEATSHVELEPSTGGSARTFLAARLTKSGDAFRGPRTRSADPIEATNAEITIRQPGLVDILTDFTDAEAAKYIDDPIEVTISLVDVVSGQAVTLQAKMERDRTDPDVLAWGFGKDVD
jgi:hypothetical protein